jgi:perosamine synthetase
MLPYGKQTIEKDDIEAVVEALQSDWLTTGPLVSTFETTFAQTVGSQHAVSFSSGTAALHAAMHAAGIGAEAKDEVIVPAITFVATSNAVLYQNAKPVFADVNPDSLLIDPEDVARKITANTKAIVAMDYAGQPCDYAALRALADQHNLVLLSDACHSLGGAVGPTQVGSLADFTCFSFHPIKQITSAEGGMVTTNNDLAATTLKEFRNHGITTDHRQRESKQQHQYAMESLGFNYRLTDLQCALGLSQLAKLKRFTRRRNDIARFYRSLLEPISHVNPLKTRTGIEHAHHLFVIRWDQNSTGLSRDYAFEQLRDRGIGVNVHYQPVYQHPYYVNRFGDQTGQCPRAEQAYHEILSLPIFPGMREEDVRRVVGQLQAITQAKPNSLSKAA